MATIIEYLHRPAFLGHHVLLRLSDDREVALIHVRREEQARALVRQFQDSTLVVARDLLQSLDIDY